MLESHVIDRDDANKLIFIDIETHPQDVLFIFILIIIADYKHK